MRITLQKCVLAGTALYVVYLGFFLVQEILIRLRLVPITDASAMQQLWIETLPMWHQAIYYCGYAMLTLSLILQARRLRAGLYAFILAFVLNRIDWAMLPIDNSTLALTISYGLFAWELALLAGLLLLYWQDELR